MSSNTLQLLIGVGIFLTIYGIVGLIRKKTTVGIGGGRSGGTKSLFDIRLIGFPNMIFCFSCILGGLVMTLPIIAVKLFHNNVDSLLLQVTPPLGLIIPGMVLVIAALIQLTDNIRSKADNEKSLTDKNSIDESKPLTK